MKASRGFTFIELLTAVVISGILAALALPSFRTLIVNNNISSDAYNLTSDLSLARSEAAKRGTDVTVCISTDGATCTGTNWNAGRIVFTDSETSGTIGVVDGSAGDTVLKVSQALPTGYAVTAANLPNATYVTYNSSGVVLGLSNGTNATFTVCNTGYIGKIVSISVTGRVGTSSTTSAC